ncbi:type II toxin-antitoxin system RelB/DinJ family antitoxin [Oenococcus kitaharae]|uniref:RelB-like antitoxin n=1 Tax=Oenococcus kitaharae DSM 17330 TaxID=1045004 RepID=G9WIN8_9LACO|nr:type II toxin-antitoxin system RelB/DinJ family antitoxin [Oenococcus kitaharae]EHN58177.1 RelB-like antitoxin [Oenococcus kitaharae DSM 17330]OEY81626.1 damage-inducible protein J [Oenococcus kitaharae]OEY83111.1 damage-inducible protein J [Oenococcus kitaharae]OEY84343.1 damage-inducible protein J [Oenococcus kitaharae]
MSDPDNKKVSISVKTNQADKEQAAAIFDSLGLNLSTAINIFIKKSIVEGGLPFDVKDPFYSEANQAELDCRFKKIANNKGIHSHRPLDDEIADHAN